MSVDVLIADDSAVTRSVLRKMMVMSGVDLGKVYEAADGQKALDYVEHEWIDIALVDLNMPVVSGYEVVDQLAQRGFLSDTPVVVITSERREAQIEILRQMGVRAFLTKPVRPEHLRDVLVEIIGGGNAD